MKNSSGITMVELVAATGIIILMFLTVSLIINPAEILSRGRDERRLNDMFVLDRVINEYNLDNAVYPDTINITRLSTALPTGNSGPLESAVDGWIDINLTDYNTDLPVDPINDDTYRYSYRHTANTYELNAVMEYYTEQMTGDGGDDTSFYELGNDLTIL